MPKIASARPSPSTSATAGAVTGTQPSTGAGNPLSHAPERASQPPRRCSNAIRWAGAVCAAPIRSSTRPLKKRSGPFAEVRPNALLPPRASAAGAVEREAEPVPVVSKCAPPLALVKRAPSPL